MSLLLMKKVIMFDKFDRKGVHFHFRPFFSPKTIARHKLKHRVKIMAPLDVLLTQVPYVNRPRVKTDIDTLLKSTSKCSLLPKIGLYGIPSLLALNYIIS